MNPSLPSKIPTDRTTWLILLAASHHDVEALRPLLSTGSASVQDADTGYTPLHAAIAACGPTTPPITHSHAATITSTISNDKALNEGLVSPNKLSNQAKCVEAAAETMRLLLKKGAIWNDLDMQNETPACLARRLGHRELYEIMVDAGVRAEFLLSRLSEYGELRDADEDDTHENENLGDKKNTEDIERKAQDESNIIKQSTEVLDTPRDRYLAESMPDSIKPGINNQDYLGSKLVFHDDRLLDQDNNGVMMAWESEIMRRTADLLLPITGLRVLNIGHGLGIVDGYFQAREPAYHHIIEAHPAVQTQMKMNGWYDKPSVIIHGAKWQDVIPKLIEGGARFDAVFFDTFAEDYKDLRTLFENFMIGLLADTGKWSFFHGQGADRQICYDVYTKILEMDLFEAGYEVKWELLKIPDLEKLKKWNGVKRRYWHLSEYKLPMCSFSA